MNKMLINAAHGSEMRVAIIDQKGKLIDLDIESPDQEQKKANIYKGKISSIEPSLGAVFVDYGSERHGFLPLKEISREYFRTDNFDPNAPNLHELLKLGQEVVVQVEKEERGTKGAALTTFISLAGAYLVLMPNNPRAGGISRRIDGDERDQLREALSKLDVPEGMGVIIRTAGVSKSPEELQWDLSVLLNYWNAIKQAAVIKDAPYLIHQESDAVIRAVRDYLRQDIEQVIVDDQEAFNRIEQYISQVRPDFVERLALCTDQVPLFSQYKVEQQIENAFAREVRLPSGGSIVIDRTEALVSIDINSARATRGNNIEETALNTNKEAAAEVARQLRLRDIGGLIVIDFIDMMQTQNQRAVEDALSNAVRVDRARIQIGRISRFGLVEMSRQRIRSGLNKTTQEICPRCDGKGTVRGVESLALTIVHSIQDQASKQPGLQFQVQVPIPVATILMNEKRHVLAEIELKTKSEVLIVPNAHLDTPHYHLKAVKASQVSHATPSYKMVKEPEQEAPTSKRGAQKPRAAEEPAVNEFLADQSSTLLRPKRPGLLTRLFRALFANKPKKTEKRQSGRRKTQRYRRNASGNTRGRNQSTGRGNRRTRDGEERGDSGRGRSGEGRGDSGRGRSGEGRGDSGRGRSSEGRGDSGRGRSGEGRGRGDRSRGSRGQSDSNRERGRDGRGGRGESRAHTRRDATAEPVEANGNVAESDHARGNSRRTSSEGRGRGSRGTRRGGRNTRSRQTEEVRFPSDMAQQSFTAQQFNDRKLNTNNPADNFGVQPDFDKPKSADLMFPQNSPPNVSDKKPIDGNKAAAADKKPDEKNSHAAMSTDKPAHSEAPSVPQAPKQAAAPRRRSAVSAPAQDTAGDTGNQ